MPRNRNDDRASWAEVALVDALRAFMKTTRTDREDALSDLLADLLHWCDSNDIDFDRELERGRGHYAEELIDPDC